MDSPKGGPLTTFIMMLPLIVVPTIAMLKPADSSGLLSSWLSAATGQEDRADSDTQDEALEFPEADDEFAALFSESPAPIDSLDNSNAETALFQEAAGDTLQDDFPTDFGAAPMGVDSQSAPRYSAPPQTAPQWPAPGLPSSAATTPDATTPDATTAGLLNQLKQAGATRTLWFSPGNGTVGFAAFFRPGPGLVSYRFEAIASTQATAVQDVIRQHQAWQQVQQR